MATTHDTDQGWTTIAARPATVDRLNEAMPYKTMSKDEFLDELIDLYNEKPVSNGGS